MRVLSRLRSTRRSLIVPLFARRYRVMAECEETEQTESSSSSTPPHRSHDPLNNLKRTDPFKFGSRYLLPNDDVYEFNAWDHVLPDPEYDSWALEQYSMQRASPVTGFDFRRFNAKPEKWWDLFYSNNAANFFKDRKWLFQEFRDLETCCAEDSGPRQILEVGAGAGNTAFPILRRNRNPHLTIHAADYSKKAVDVMRKSPLYPHTDEEENNTETIGSFRAEVYDVTVPSTLPLNVEPGSIDVVILIFIFSALAPPQWRAALTNVWRALKPGGVVCFRDYGRGDLAQVRFKKGRWMADNFYVRGDGTRVYFFDRDEISSIFDGSIDWNALHEQWYAEHSEEQEQQQQEENIECPHFEILDLGVDRRLLVNRQRKLKMYRCWLQGRFRKPL